MKNILSVLIVAGLCSARMEAEEISVAGYLDKAVTVEISEKSLTGAVHALMEKMREGDLDVLRLKFAFQDTSKFDEHREIKLKFDNVKFSKALNDIGTAYKHAVNYDFRKNVIVFTAAPDDEDDERKYKITEEVSGKLGLSWASEEELQKSLNKFGVKAILVKSNLSERTFTANGSPVSLDHLDMLIYVFSQVPK